MYPGFQHFSPFPALPPGSGDRALLPDRCDNLPVGLPFLPSSSTVCIVQAVTRVSQIPPLLCSKPAIASVGFPPHLTPREIKVLPSIYRILNDLPTVPLPTHLFPPSCQLHWPTWSSSNTPGTPTLGLWHLPFPLTRTLFLQMCVCLIPPLLHISALGHLSRETYPVHPLHS